MASVRKLKNGKFIVEILVSGKRKSKTFDLELEANVWALEYERSKGIGNLITNAVICFKMQVTYSA
mgnify:CR=1 FL=1